MTESKKLLIVNASFPRKFELATVEQLPSGKPFVVLKLDASASDLELIQKGYKMAADDLRKMDDE